MELEVPGDTGAADGPRRLPVYLTDHGPGPEGGGGDRRPTVLLLHGNPTWAYLYRDVLAELGGEVRCLAPDYPGFGRSRRPGWYRCSPREHAAVVRELVRDLEPGPLILVGHDWGGPIGLAVAASMPDRVTGLVLSNTWCWRPDLRMWGFSLLMGGRWPGRWLQLRRNFLVRRVLPAGFHSRERRTEEALGPYRAPFPTPESRLGTWIFPRAIRTEMEWVEEVAGRLGPVRNHPATLVWGMRDPAFGREEYLDRWRRLLPRGRVDRVEDASHYVPEERPDRIWAAIRRVLREAD